MNYTILFGIIMAGIIGWVRGGEEMKRARIDPNIGIPPSKNLFTYLFLDEYR
jgi:hypothetical protein